MNVYKPPQMAIEEGVPITILFPDHLAKRMMCFSLLGIFLLSPLRASNPKNQPLADNYGISKCNYIIWDAKDLTKKTTEHGVCGIVFLDSGGKIIKKVPFRRSDTLEDGHHIRYLGDTVHCRSGDSIAGYEERIDLTDGSPFRIRKSSSIHFMWFRRDGSAICSFRGHMKPVALSPNGRYVALVDYGLSPEVLSQNISTKTQLSSEQYRDLTTTYLKIMNDSCEISYTTSSPMGKLEIVKVSTGGNWMVIAINGSANFNVINIKNAISYTVQWDKKLKPHHIDEDGTFTGYKAVSERINKHTVSFAAGNSKGTKEYYMPTIRRYEWKPGMSDFQDTGEEIK